MRFVDTNVLLYVVSTNPLERAKASPAVAILNESDDTGEDGGLALSVQVLQEFYIQSTRRTRDGALTHEQAANLIEAFLRSGSRKIRWS